MQRRYALLQLAATAAAVVLRSESHTTEPHQSLPSLVCAGNRQRSARVCSRLHSLLRQEAAAEPTSSSISSPGAVASTPSLEASALAAAAAAGRGEALAPFLVVLGGRPLVAEGSGLGLSAGFEGEGDLACSQGKVIICCMSALQVSSWLHRQMSMA